MSFTQDFQHRAILPSSAKVVPKKVNTIFRTPTITKRTPAFTSTDNTGINDLSLFTGQGPRGVFTSAVLLDTFPGATVLLSLSRESSTYSGSALTMSRANGTGAVNLGFTGNNLDIATLNSFLSGGTAFVDTWFDQSGNGNNATQPTLNKRFQLIIDIDGNPSLISNNTSDSTSGMFIADASSHKTAVIDMYFVGKIGVTNNDSINYDETVVAWTPTGTAQSVARWGFILSEGGFGDGLELVRNGTAATRTSATLPAAIPLGNGYRTSFHVWNYNSNRLAVRRNDVLLWDDVASGGSSLANVTYSGTGKLCIGQNFDGTQNSNGTFRTIAIYGSTQASRTAITSYLSGRWIVPGEFPTAFNSGDGWLWTPDYSSTFVTDSVNDSNSLQWTRETGGYRDDGSRGPSFAKASNVNNGIEFVRFAVKSLDNDTVVTGAERAEREGLLNGITKIAVGDDYEIFAQFQIEPGPTQTGSWAFAFQTHYDGGASPDIMALGLLNDQFQIITQRNGTDTLRGSASAFSRSTWYAIRASVHWSASGTADTLAVWLGLNGGTLTQTVNVSGSLFSTDTAGSYIKQGLYRGFPGNNSGVLAIRIANHKFSKTAGAFASFVTTQPALPTHS